jgi:hypothetical protein
MSMRAPLYALLVIVAAGLAACDPTPPADVDEAALDDAVGQAIGSPSTCVLVAEADGDLVYRYGSNTICARSILACDAPGTTTVGVQLDAVVAGAAARTISCETAPLASRGVAWASGRLPPLKGKPDRNMLYSAMMEGPEAFSGREMRLRLEAAFARAGF